jgi:hypothetical protein
MNYFLLFLPPGTGIHLADPATHDARESVTKFSDS